MNRRLTIPILGATFALALASLQPAMAATDQTGIGTFNDVLNGNEAISALGRDLPAIADSLDVSTHELTAALQEEHTSVLPNGRIAMAHPAAPAGTSRAPIALGADWDVPLSSVFTLQSKPNAKRTIYLDFNGHSITKNNFWSKYYKMPKKVTGYTIDSNSQEFSSEERRSIAWIWAQVAEDYAAFDVNVTTKAPKKVATTLQRSSAKDSTYGTHVVITSQANASNNICDGACSGVAFIGVFNHYKGKKYGGAKDNTSPANLQPAWVFDGNASTGRSANYIADTASHEAGHTLGLFHSASNAHEYYPGHNNWAPIMGTTSGSVNSYRAVSQWSNGHYPNARSSTNSGPVSHQDQIKVIQANGLPLRSDDHNHTVSASKKARAGFIARTGDVDVVTIGHCPAGASIRVDTATMANLDTTLSLLNTGGSPVTNSAGSATGSVVTGNSGTAFPSWARMPSNMGTTITTTSAGVFYLRISGEGSVANNYPTYGSLGKWLVSSPCDSNGVGPVAGTPVNVGATPKSKAVTLAWGMPTTGRIQDITGWRITRTGSKKNVNVSVNGRSKTITGLKNGTNYTFTVRPLIGKSKKAGAATAVISATPKTVPSTPKISKAKSGAKGGDITASVTWKAPSNGGSPITAYYVTAKRYSGKKVVQTITTPALPATTRTYEMALPTAAKYVFTVTAENEIGKSKASKASSKVNGR